MAEKYRRTSTPIRDVFVNNLKGKLGEEVVKSRLGDFVTEVDYEKRIGGDGKVDFTLTSDSSIGIQVKVRYGNFNKIKWSISQEEIEKNAVLVCILCQEEFSETEKEYGLIIAGFLPTNIIKSTGDKTLVGIDELLYPSGLRGYLENFKSFTSYDYDKYIRLGDECVNNEDYQGAIFDYYHALHLRSNEAITYYESDAIMAIIYCKIGNARYTLGEYEGAIYNYTQAIKLNPASDNAYYNRGGAYYTLEKYQDAINNYTQAIKLNPASDNAYYNRGNAYYTLEKYQNAINDYTQAIKLNPEFAGAYYNRGNVYYTLEKYQDAINNYTQAIKLNPEFAGAYYKRGISHKNLGKYQDAINDYTQAIKLNPEFAGAYCNRGNTYKILQKYQDAINNYTQAINLDPKFAIAYYNRGVIYKESRKYKDAINDFSQVINLDSKFAIAYYNRGSVNLILENNQAAIDDFKKATSIYKQENNFHDYHKTLEQLKNIQCNDVDLISAVGMDYRKLRDLLKTGKWMEADEETRRVMLEVAKREEESWLDHDSIDNFPSEDLRTIDYLWVKYSNGKFGFSVQKRIYQCLGVTLEYDSKIWDQFIHKIGRYINDINTPNDINAPEGYFPGSVGGIWLGWEEGIGYEFVNGWFDDYLFRRVEICKLYNIRSKKIYEPLTKHNTQVSDDYEDNYLAEDLNNNDDYFDDYISDYDDYFDDYNDYDYEIKQFSQNTKQYLL
ncbi:tetratricopeptide repeat protein [Anabaena azotica]|uniref:tetratricopeptide repeat protein n=1 Tax=Anabaena azotica TaxID=197653 RepID=UPI0039A68BD6